MNETMIISLVKDAFYYTLIIGGPILLVSLIVGLLISIFQAATSISEQTLTFVPKLIAIFLVLVIILPFIISKMKELTYTIFNMIQNL
ncbi:MAG TPA: flagellar biosynthesis protein FliQ [Candidatus Kapabacteria bacterium]|jgi:flagellar biosynthetic protein FliQ|nr:flagellar biosynthesis protein FliQ [Candidatus Kapabacteria bacterium]HOV91699.1 flagellar biosynthesis protein FliQ [Candidatus Kapabacteria bacterium]